MAIGKLQHWIRFAFRGLSAKPALTVLVIILFVTLLVSATTLALGEAGSGQLEPGDVRFVVGSDSLGGARVSISPTADYAQMSFWLLPSETNYPQPDTFYTDLLEIQNVGSESHNVKSITISNIRGTANLGILTIYLFDNQTDTPTYSSPIQSVTLTETSDGAILLSGAHTLDGSSSHYLEIVGHASPDALEGSVISFSLSMQVEDA